MLRLNTPTQRSFSAGATVVLNQGYRYAQRTVVGSRDDVLPLAQRVSLPGRSAPGQRDLPGGARRGGEGRFALTTATELAAPLRETLHMRTRTSAARLLLAAGDALRVGRETMALDSTQPGEAGVCRVARDDPRSPRKEPHVPRRRHVEDLAVTTETLELEEVRDRQWRNHTLSRHGARRDAHGSHGPESHPDRPILPGPGHTRRHRAARAGRRCPDGDILLPCARSGRQAVARGSTKRATPATSGRVFDGTWTTPVTQNLDGGGGSGLRPQRRACPVPGHGTDRRRRARGTELAALLRAHDHIRIDTEWVRVHAVDVDRSIAYVVRSARASRSKFVSIARAPKAAQSPSGQWSRSQRRIACDGRCRHDL